jgi:DNA-binding response OmpR family regulator
LIVADDQSLLAMYAFGLLAMGFQPVVVQNSDDWFARACELQPDVVVVDVEMAPVLHLPRRLHSDTRTRDAVIIALSGDGSTAKGPSDAFDRLLPKLCSSDTLALAIRDVFAHRRLAAEAGHSK